MGYRWIRYPDEQVVPDGATQLIANDAEIRAALADRALSDMTDGPAKSLLLGIAPAILERGAYALTLERKQY